jgi:YhcN/YlaJ family sporulation lipoprotein
MKFILMIILTASLFFSGCAMRNPANQSPAPKQQANVQQTQRVPQTAPEVPKNQSPEATARRLVNLTMTVPEVHHATAVVFRKTAIVGISLDAKLERSKVGTVKYAVAQALKKDPQGANAMVTADPAIVARIQEINQQVRNGHPLSGFANELADIAGRVMPQFPKSIADQKVKNKENLANTKP